MHCHVEYHGSAGMSVVFQVGDLEQIPTAPKRMRHCGDFEYSEEEYYASMNNGNDSSVPSTHPDHPQRGECEYWLWYITCVRYPTWFPSDRSIIHARKPTLLGDNGDVITACGSAGYLTRWVHYKDAIIEFMFVSENYCPLLQHSLKYVHDDPINPSTKSPITGVSGRLFSSLFSQTFCPKWRRRVVRHQGCADLGFSPITFLDISVTMVIPSSRKSYITNGNQTFLIR